MSEFALHPYTPGDAAWVAQVHGDLYQRYEGFNADFQKVVEQALQDFAPSSSPPTAAGWIAWRGTQRVGCIFCAEVTPKTAKIRMFLLLPSERGQGQGRQMLLHAMKFARETGFAEMKIGTYAEHTAACRLYQRIGFTLTSSKPAQAFGRNLTEQHWHFTLTVADFS